MIETWNAIIKTPDQQFYTVFSIYEDGNHGLRLVMESEPLYNNITFDNIRTYGNILKATGFDENGDTHKLEIALNGEMLSGALISPSIEPVVFIGRKGRGISLTEKLQQNGQLSV
ncbi:hypothetical protein [Paenibacillus prosopidis]|uniref:Uncharacterized protein n=1 Tax=Paenibacillus prosopidis TaxID=630520 RepID=A0A368VPP6_9BACL|nr:hypothetical protein [Paenibacillus prosopidis]RCW43478.1 hypothetical protein DFP97_113151 [Paenibacillus prosopidis]